MSYVFIFRIRFGILLIKIIYKNVSIFQLQNCGHTIKSSRKIEISKGQQNGFCFDVLLTSVMLWHYSGFSQTNCCYGFTKMLIEKVTWFGLGYTFIHCRTLLVRFTDRLLLWLNLRQSCDLFFNLIFHCT